ncbi:hypothetical protein KQI85_09350 [Falcatimonas sp. MSJ-15]|nr:hypothetical protein [Falcatimonas sp. MSJ-15]MBU5470579.1 hypothetical protein [Falcatimonas sp. MSJ-15]
MKKWRKKIFFSIAILLTIWLLWGNYSVDINHISVSDEMIPSEFRNYKIIQISDLHNANFGNGQNYLIKLINAYSDCNINLVLSGHAHGGQFRIPFIGGLVAPNQGFFPKYTSGKYIVGNTQMIVSRGLGNSIIPLRINNRPEVVVITLN